MGNNKKSNSYSNKHVKEISKMDYSKDITGPAYAPPPSDVTDLPTDRADNSVIYMDISTEGGRTLRTLEVTKPHLIGRLYFELRQDLCPLTCTNFLSLITCAKGVAEDGLRYGYKGTKLHRIVKNVLFQGGDLLDQNGHCSRSIYGNGNVFCDENFIFRHTGPGCLAMANRGADTNGSTYHVCFSRNEDLDNKYVVFGCLCDSNSFEVLSKINLYGTESGTPLETLYISDCGVAYPIPVASK